MKYRVTAPPIFEPITADEARRHLRADDDFEDNEYIGSLIVAAREYCEAVTRRALATQTIEAYPERLCSTMELPMPPLQSVQSIKYTDSTGAEYTISADSYIVDVDSEPGRVALPYGGSWPAFTANTVNPIKITYTAGYSDGRRIPNAIKQAMLLLIGHWYANREAVGMDVGKPIEFAVESLLSVHKAGWF